MEDQDTKLDNEHTSRDQNLNVNIDQLISKLNDNDQPDSLSPPEIIEPVQHFADLFDVTLVAYESGSKTWIQLQQDNSFRFLESVDRTNKLIKSLSKYQTFAAAINRLSGIQERAMSILEIEFTSAMDDYQKSYDRDQKAITDENTNTMKNLSSSDPSKVEDVSEPDLPDQSENETRVEKDEFLGYSDEMLSELNKLANGLIGGGHEPECSEIYFFVRRNAMEQNLKVWEFEKFSIDEMQKMQWDHIEKEICSWMMIFKRFCNSLLPSEQRLAAVVFSNHAAISARLFGKLTRNILLCFLSFAEAVMMTKRSAEKLFKFLDVYETLRDNIPTVEKLVTGEWLQQLKSSAVLISYMLGESIFTIFIELENSIKSDTTKTPVPGGAVHPLTRYAMNYLKYACEYSDTLEQVFRDHQKIDGSDSLTGSEQDQNYQQEQDQSNEATHGSGSPFQSQLAKIMDLLDANLEAKSRLYKDPSLSLIFMMNNGRYILQKTKGTGEMRTIMGDPWVRKRSSDLQNYHTCYKRETWTNVLQCLSHEGLSVNGKVMKPVLKERFKNFNAMFDEIHKTQTAWVVSDEQLQSELRVSISAIVIPAYRSFMGRFSQVFTPGRQTAKYIKYQPEDIETCIEELFDGSAAQQGRDNNVVTYAISMLINQEHACKEAAN